MTPQDIKTISEYAFQSKSSVKIILSHGKTGMGQKFLSFCETLSLSAPHITFKKDSDITFEEPVMVIGRHSNIAYYTLPTTKYLKFFLKALDNSAARADSQAGPSGEQADIVELPAGLKLYVADQCPHCPQFLGQIQDLANKTSKIRLRVINVEMFPEKAKNDQVKSVPTLILDDQFRWTGQVDSEEVLKICGSRDPSELSTESLRQLIEDGNAGRLATMMIESGIVFPAFTELLTHPRWPVRLGAMVAAEYLADEAPALGLELCQLLWRDFSDLEPPVQGDVTHIFGLLSDEMTKGYLQEVMGGDFEDDVKEAAQEALEEIGG